MLRAEDSPSFIHESHHDQFMKGKTIQKVNTGPRRVLADKDSSDFQWRKMRMQFDWSIVENFVKDDTKLVKKMNYMKQILGTVENYFETRIDVNSRQVLDLTKSTSCFEFNVPEVLRTKLETDLLIMVQPYDEPTGWFAAAGACLTDSISSRPVAGVVMLNFHHIDPSHKINQYYHPLVFIHEVLHILGFNDYTMADRGLMSKIDMNGKSRWAVTSPNVVQYAKSYFGCDSIKGVPLENNGGNGSAYSHWEKSIFPSEIMNPRVAYPATISEFTIKLLEDLGWYRGDQAHQRYVYLKGEGCSIFHDIHCGYWKTTDEFCGVDEFDEDHCYPNKLAKSHCYRDSKFSSDCSLKYPSFNSLCTSDNLGSSKAFDFESYGAHSRCI